MNRPRTDVDALLGAVREIEPVIRAHAPDAERERRLPEPVVDAMRDAGLHRLWRPAALGGLEVDPVTGFRVLEEVSRIDSAAGWNLQASLATELFGPWFEDTTVTEVFGEPRTVLAGAFNPPRQAIPVDGGYRVTGRTPFTSGAHSAAWLLGLANVMDGGQPRLGPGGEPMVLMTLIPSADFEIVDSWDTMGMCGTGSHDVTVNGALVPERRAVPYVPLERSASAYRGPLYRLTVWPVVAGLAVPALGVARAAIEEVVALTTVKTPAYTTRPLRERAVAQAQLARAAATLDAARAYLHAAFEAAYADATAGRPITLDHKRRMQLAATHAVHGAADAVDLVHAIVGATGIRREHPFERHFRDVHVLTQHAFVCASRYEDVGRIMMGGDPEWSFFSF